MAELLLAHYYSITMIALTLWREARNQTIPARVAVAHTIKNRIDHPGWWGNDWVSVITKKWQYSSVTDPNDPQLTNWPSVNDKEFLECLDIAVDVFTGKSKSPLPGIDSYYDDSLQGDKRPKWAKEHPERFKGKIGRLNFYNMDCDVEDPHVLVKETEA